MYAGNDLSEILEPSSNSARDDTITVTRCPFLQVNRHFLSPAESSGLYKRLLEEQHWSDSVYEVFDRRFTLPRLQTWHADKGIVYSYSNNLLKTQPWTPLLQQLKQKIEASFSCTFNSVLVNYYRNGQDYVGWHSDDEAELGPSPLIVSVSLGATRSFCFRRKKRPEVMGDILLHSGNLLIMRPEFQHYWQHSVPRDDQLHGRINLTFRYVNPPEYNA